jgi:hypothetical protein
MNIRMKVPRRSPWADFVLFSVALLWPLKSWAGAPDLRNLPDIASVTVVEQTDTLRSHVFALGANVDPRLLSAIPGGPSEAQWDFSGAQEEFYDVYLSDAFGNVDAHGGYISIVCQFAPTSDIGNNIDAIALNFSGKPDTYADEASSLQLSPGLAGQFLCHAGFALRALGAPDASSTRLSEGGLSRLTLGFGNAAASRLLAATLLRTAGGMRAATPQDGQRGDLVVAGDCDATLDLVDAVAAARLAAGL